MDAINEDNMRKYFDLLEEVFNHLDFKNHPERIYNMDETGMPLDPHPLTPKVVAPKGQMKVYDTTLPEIRGYFEIFIANDG